MTVTKFGSEEFHENVLAYLEPLNLSAEFQEENLLLKDGSFWLSSQLFESKEIMMIQGYSPHLWWVQDYGEGSGPGWIKSSFLQIRGRYKIWLARREQRALQEKKE